MPCSRLGALAAAWLVLVACAGPAETTLPPPVAPPVAPVAAPSHTATIEARSGSKVTGKATFTEGDGGVKVSLSIDGAPPGDHGAHVHETGDCSAPDGESAGDHFNPTKHDHALPGQQTRHLGDLGNVAVGADGHGAIEITIPGATLKAGEANSFAGRAVIVHADRDDGGQPSGNAGGRVGCGVITD